MSAQEKAENNTPYIDRGQPLPGSYAENRIVALARDPEMTLIYWDVDTEVRVSNNPLVLRVHTIIDASFHDLDLSSGADNMYLAVSPNHAYCFELFERGPSAEDDSLRLLATSNEVTTPVRWAGQSDDVPPEEMLHALRHPLTRLHPPQETAATVGATSDRRRPRSVPTPAPTPVSGEASGPYYHSGGHA